MAALAFAAWTCRDSEPVRRFWPSGLPSVPALSAVPGKLAGTGASQALGGLRKCRSGANVAYTDSACPPGSHEEAMVGGSLTIVPAQRAAQGPAKPQSLLRTLSGPEQDDLQRKRIERAVDQ